ncbi:hypothetical protein DFH08DRAFT_945155 [Mycena albidolilacea]|uniref:Uncharacterized protein n=1 Tax=Mycena albidolilacea TaxID=1033008 RepID=A0AAD6Z2A4_9AGAR|nr:hypothetical protein DFH08DRAFT_945155 [Mycena albidolilacea]
MSRGAILGPNMPGSALAVQKMLASRSLRVVRRAPVSLPCLAIRTLHWRTPATCRPKLLAHNFWALSRPKTRQYSDEAQVRILEEGIPLQHSGPTTASLLAYGAAHWPAPDVLPAGWSADWARWDYLLTLFAFSPYFLRLPQIEMLVNVKYGIPGEVRPIMYSDAREMLLFSTEVLDQPDESDSDSGAPEARTAQPQKPAQDGDGAGFVFLLNCRTFELWTYDPDVSTSPQNAPSTIQELVLLVAAAPTPAGVPMLKLEPDPEGEAALARILARDPTVIPVLEEEFLGYAPRATERAEELLSADDVHARHKEKWGDAILKLRVYVKETETELEADERELADLRATGSAELRESEGDNFRLDEAAHAQMRAALAETKGKLAEWERQWVEAYGADGEVTRRRLTFAFEACPMVDDRQGLRYLCDVIRPQFDFANTGAFADNELLFIFGRTVTQDAVGLLWETLFVSAYGVFFWLAVWSIARKRLKTPGSVAMLLIVVYLYASSLTLWSLNVVSWFTRTRAFFMRPELALDDRKAASNAAVTALGTPMEALFMFNVRSGLCLCVISIHLLFPDDRGRRRGHLARVGAVCARAVGVIDLTCLTGAGYANQTAMASGGAVCERAELLSWAFSLVTNGACTLTQYILFVDISRDAPIIYVYELFAGMGDQISGMYPTLIIVIVNLHHTLWDDSAPDARADSSMHFTTGAKRSGSDITGEPSGSQAYSGARLQLRTDVEGTGSMAMSVVDKRAYSPDSPGEHV